MTVGFEQLVELNVTEYDTISDLFVFDNMVAVRLNETGFTFFMEPLVEGSIANPIPAEPI